MGFTGIEPHRRVMSIAPPWILVFAGVSLQRGEGRGSSPAEITAPAVCLSPPVQCRAEKSGLHLQIDA